jgi:hypothetical protein
VKQSLAGQMRHLLLSQQPVIPSVQHGDGGYAEGGSQQHATFLLAQLS